MAKGSYDYSEFRQFYENFSKLDQGFETWLTKFLLDEGMRFIRNVKLRTPVDTGDLRNHWMLQGISRSGNELHCWFVNTMRYATFVEYGHAKPYKSGATEGSADWVPGYFMMTVTLDKIQRTMPERFESKFLDFLARLGIQ